MPYSKPTYPSNKTVLIQHNQQRLQHFKLGKANGGIEIHPPSFIPWKTERVNGDLYNKTSSTLNSQTNSTLDIIRKNEEFDSFIWHTQPRYVQEAVRFGFVETESVTSKVVGALGQYRLVTLERLKAGYISNRYTAKEKLVSHYQDRFEALEILESLVNQPIDQKVWETAFGLYINRLETIKTTLCAAECLQEMNRHLARDIAIDIKQAAHYAKRFSKTKLNATGIDSVLTFVKKSMIHNLRKMQNHNQNITYDRKKFFATTRGELDSCIEDAEKVIEDYNAPPRDSILPEHHGSFMMHEKQIAFDSKKHCKTRKSVERALLAITFIEKMNQLDHADSKKPTLILSASNNYALRIVNNTIWRISASNVVLLKRMLTWGINVSIKLMAGIIELPLTLIVEPLIILFVSLIKPLKFCYRPKFFKTVRHLATDYEIKINDPNAPKLNGQALFDQTKQQQYSLGFLLRHLAVNAIKNLLHDVIHSARDIYKKITIHLFDEIYDDYSDGERLPNGAPLPYQIDTILQQSQQQIQSIHEKRVRIEKNLRLPNLPAVSELPCEKLAQPPFLPSAGEFNDLFNTSVAGTNQFVTWFTHNIHAKYPLLGLLYTLTYFAGGFAVITPKWVSFLSQRFISLSQTLGYSMAKNPFTAAIGSASTQAQIITSGCEVILDGPHSMTASAAKAIEKDPFTMLVYASTALGLGYMFAYQLHIPWLSQSLRDDLGSVPQAALSFVGVKLGIITYELLKEHDHTQEASSAQQKQVTYTRALLVFLMEHQAALPYLSAQTKYQIVQLCRQHFKNNFDVRSLKQLLYPTEEKSILRNTADIILGYPLFFIRLIAACISSFIQGNLSPLRSACTNCQFKIMKDITRLFRAGSKTCKMFAAFLHRHIKTVGDILMNSLLARGEALLFNTHRIADCNYTLSGKSDTHAETLRQMLAKPIDYAIKSVTIAHPVDTLQKQQRHTADKTVTISHSVDTIHKRNHANVAELADALDLGSSGVTCESSSLSVRI